MSSKGSHETHLVAGLFVFVAMTLTLAAIANVSNGEPLIDADAQLSTWLHTRGSPRLTTALWILTALGSTELAICVAVGMGLYLLWKRQPYWFVAISLSVFGGMLLNRFLKYVFHRPRPHFDDPILLSLTGYSFPSGHTMAATVLYGALAAYLVSRTQSLRKRALVILSASLLIVLVAFSRIYLGAHYLSDVLAAIAEGMAWLSLCLTGVYSLWRRHDS